MDSCHETFDEAFSACEAVTVWDFPDGPMSYARRLKAAHDREISGLRKSLRIAIESARPHRNCDKVHNFREAKQGFHLVNKGQTKNYCRRLCYWLLSPIQNCEESV